MRGAGSLRVATAYESSADAIAKDLGLAALASSLHGRNRTPESVADAACTPSACPKVEAARADADRADRLCMRRSSFAGRCETWILVTIVLVIWAIVALSCISDRGFTRTTNVGPGSAPSARVVVDQPPSK